MSEIPWRTRIEQSLATLGNAPQTRWLQLATVSPDGWPRVRTVVFRGFVGDGPILRFTTDLRSEKVRQIAWNSRAEACWLFPETREQFRLSGHLHVVGEDEPEQHRIDDRAEAWASLLPQSRLAFTWPEPGAPWADPSRFPPSATDLQLPPACFSLLLLEPERVDSLDLRTDPHTRIRYHRTAVEGRRHWEAIAVNP